MDNVPSGETMRTHSDNNKARGSLDTCFAECQRNFSSARILQLVAAGWCPSLSSEPTDQHVQSRSWCLTTRASSQKRCTGDPEMVSPNAIDFNDRMVFDSHFVCDFDVLGLSCCDRPRDIPARSIGTSAVALVVPRCCFYPDHSTRPNMEMGTVGGGRR